MWRQLRSFMVCLAAVALPLQGMAGAGMGVCHSGVPATMNLAPAAESAAKSTVVAHALHAEHDHAKHVAAVGDGAANGVAGDVASDVASDVAGTPAKGVTDATTCGACSAGCCGAALRSAAPLLAAPAHDDAFVAALLPHFSQAVLPGLERPPRGRSD